MADQNDNTVDRLNVIAGLREFADFLEAHPTIPVSDQNFLSYVFTREELAAIAALTSWEKVYETDDYFTLRKRFKSGVRFDVYTERANVCRKVVTGTRIVPAQPATAESVEDVTEWVCDEPLLAKTR